MEKLPGIAATCVTDIRNPNINEEDPICSNCAIANLSFWRAGINGNRACNERGHLSQFLQGSVTTTRLAPAIQCLGAGRLLGAGRFGDLGPVATTLAHESRLHRGLDQALWACSCANCRSVDRCPVSDPVRHLPAMLWTTQAGLVCQGDLVPAGLLLARDLYVFNLESIWPSAVVCLLMCHLFPFARLASIERLAFHWPVKPDEHHVQYYPQVATRGTRGGRFGRVALSYQLDVFLGPVGRRLSQAREQLEKSDLVAGLENALDEAGVSGHIEQP
ncbi:hypothetical protein RF11_14447 [Thelohanellus kitauei]|uniref:GATA-type domain-containing protein n=1 Tax=Thelohanellus kitauei TaxID=669202 RepID=A0A0C2MUN0_THEKT|nr:hypothetical protein RF11_14447 [Thelohanellus kitauei]